MSISKWTEVEIAFMRREYPHCGKKYCAEVLGRSECSIRWMASELRLRLNHDSHFFKDFQRRAAASKVGKKRPEHSRTMKRLHKENRFPKTKEMLEAGAERLRQWMKAHEGMGLTDEAKQKKSRALKESWKRMTHEDKSRRTLKILKTKFAKGTYSLPRKNASWHGGKRKMGEVEKYFKSSWEANYARYLEWQRTQGVLRGWEYESQIFWFEGIRRGCVSYLPDFKVTDNDGGVEFHEVKGYMDAKSKTKLRRMAKYYPDVRVVLIDAKRYRAIAKTAKGIVPEWE